MSHVDDAALHAFLDGACGGREHAEIEAHLAACGECRERLERAEALSRRASALLAELEPGPLEPPSWREIEERAAARRATVSRRPRLRPSLAWVASLVIAFGIGWFTSSYRTGVPTGARGELTAVAGARNSVDAGRAEPDLAAPAEPDAAARQAGRDDRASGALARKGADELRDEAVTPAQAPPPPAGAAEAEAEMRRREPDAPLRPEALADRVSPTVEAARALEARVPAARESEARAEGPARFLGVQPQEAALWLNGELRTLPDLQLQRVEVGPGSAVPGMAGGPPAVRLVYSDAAGHEITLVQQRVADPSSEELEPSLLIDPSGLKSYRWLDDDYRLILIASVSSDSLRALAARVR